MQDMLLYACLALLTEALERCEFVLFSLFRQQICNRFRDEIMDTSFYMVLLNEDVERCEFVPFRLFCLLQPVQ